MLFWERGEPSRAIEAMHEAIHFGEKAGFVVPLVFTRGMLAAIYASLGAQDQALEIANLAVSTGAEKFPALLPIANVFLARVRLLRGELSEAKDALRKIDDVRNPISYVIDLYIQGTQTKISLEDGEFDKALLMAEESIAMMKKINSHLFLPEHIFLRSEALERLGREDEAFNSFQEGRAAAQAHGLNSILWQILAQMADIETTRGNEGKAASLRKQSRTIILTIADNIAQEDLRTSFLALPKIGKILG